MRRLPPFAAALLATAIIAAPGIAADSKTKTETSTSTEKSGDKPDSDVAAASTTEDAQPSRHSVQIELNRALYLDEANGTRGPGFNALRNVLADVTRDFCAFTRELTGHAHNTAPIA